MKRALLLLVCLLSASAVYAQQPVSQGPQASNAAPWTVNGTGTFAVQAAQSGTWTDTVTQGTASLLNATVVQGTASSLNATVVGTGTFAVQAAQSGTWTVQPGNTANSTPWLFTRIPDSTSTAAASACNILSAASTNATNCKGSAGNFIGFEVFNTTTTVYYLRMYNNNSTPTCSSSVGFVRSIPIPPASASGLVGGVVSNFTFGVNYSTGIGYCITAGSASNDNTNAATGVFGEIRYK